MKILKLKALLAALVISASGMATAAPIQDTLIGARDLGNAGDANVITWLNFYAGTDYTTDDLFKIEKQGNQNIPGVVRDAGGLWTISAPTEPGYFILKFGTGNAITDNNHFFFENIVDLNQLVFSDEDVDFLSGGACASNGNNNSCNIGRLSFYAWVPGEDGTGGSGGNPVPEPATLMLLGAGMAGMMLRRRRR